MISSMTGYGRAEKDINDQKAVVEVTSVNNRFLEMQIRLPRTLIGLEPKIKKLLSTKLHRGKINFSLIFEDNMQLGSRLSLNTEIADMYYRVYSDLKKHLNLSGDISMDHFVAVPDLITAESSEIDLDKIWSGIEPICQQALDSHCRMRLDEGENLYADFAARLKLLSGYVDQIKANAGNNINHYREKLDSRIKELMGDFPIDQQRLAMEIALMAEKTDITEEITRLESHIENFAKTLDHDNSVGKRLTFILQEMHREANTITSKAMDYEISELVINIKEELEKLREQSMNIE